MTTPVFADEPDDDSRDGLWLGALDVLLAEDGFTRCAQPDACSVCVLFTQQQSGETRREWLYRIQVRVYAAECTRLRREQAHPVAFPTGSMRHHPRWSKFSDRCQSSACTTPEQPHGGGGNCKTCYARERRRADAERRAS